MRARRGSYFVSQGTSASLSGAVACDLELCRRDLAVIQPSHPSAGKRHICTDMHAHNHENLHTVSPLEWPSLAPHDLLIEGAKDFALARAVSHCW